MCHGIFDSREEIKVTTNMKRMYTPYSLVIDFEQVRENNQTKCIKQCANWEYL